MTKEEEIGILEKQKVMSNESEFMKFKTDFLNDYFEKLDVSSNEPDWNVMILQTMKFKEFLDCKALLDMMDDDEYVRKYTFILELKFDEMVDWFITKKLGVTTRPIPAYASNNRKVSLLNLYLVVEREGGHRQVTENNLWAMVAKDMGFEYSDGELMRLIYAMYLDVLVYYHKFKIIQSNVHDKEVTEERETLASKMDPRGSRSEGGQAEQVAGQAEKDEVNQEVAENQSELYALFAGNDRQGIKRLNTRRRFDFNRAKAAVDDANDSILKHSRKHNYGELTYLGKKLSHPNLLKLIGYNQEYTRILVYEFMSRGSLEDQLFHKGEYLEPLSWGRRIKIALGAAKGLAYLHSPEAKVIFRGLSSSSILIDSNYNAKLYKFRFAKDLPQDGKMTV
ncbi:putative transferase, protein kinase RLK-Pelle-RLCK-VIIa-2 family [Helianthus annuus]|nr:putative transferase, protein kinase RLK-Pelle-RLCK-VIIa-2 family [Helianthus annuus]